MNLVKGRDRRSWHTNVPAYRALVYPAVYPGVDFFVRNPRGAVEFGFTLEPEAEADRIAISVAGATELRITRGGRLEIMTSGGPIILAPPKAFEEVAGGVRDVPARFALLGRNTFGFEIGRRTPGARLIIDPPVVFAAYIGGEGSESSGVHYTPVGPLRSFVDLQFGTDGAAYLVANTASPDFPFITVGELTGFNDVAVLKLSTEDQSLAYVTILGGQAASYPTGIAPTADGSAFVTGWTRAPDFPTSSDVIHEQREDGGGFVLRLAPEGTFDIGTLVGSAPDLYPNAVRLMTDADGAVEGVFVAGGVGPSAAEGDATPGAFQTEAGGGFLDGFVARIEPDLTAYSYLTLLGGAGDDVIHDIAVLGGTAFVVGTTSSFDFPVSSAFVKQPEHSAAGSFSSQGQCVGGHSVTLYYPDDQRCFDGFMARLAADGSGLVFSTYHGTQGAGDFLHGVGIVSASGNPLDGTAVATGRSHAPDGSGAILVARATGLGSPGPEGADFAIPAAQGHGARVAVDEQGGVHIVGSVAQSGLTRGDQHTQQHHGDWDMFYMRIPPGAVSHDYFTYLGGSDGDWGSGIDTLEVDGRNFCIALGGHSFSDDVGPTDIGQPVEGEHEGGTDILVFALCPLGDTPPERITLGKTFVPDSASPGQQVVARFTITSTAPASVSLEDEMPDGLTVISAPAVPGGINCSFEPLVCQVPVIGGNLSFDVPVRVAEDACARLADTELMNTAQLLRGGELITSATDTLEVDCPDEPPPEDFLEEGESCGDRPAACEDPLVCGRELIFVESCLFPSFWLPTPLGFVCFGGFDTETFLGPPRCMPANQADGIVDP